MDIIVFKKKRLYAEFNPSVAGTSQTLNNYILKIIYGFFCT